MPKVLVVDDSLSVRKVVEKALARRGLQVLAAASGAEAIEVLERDRPDLVICDVILPDQDGYQICQYVRAHSAIGATPVLLISGIDNGTVMARAAEVRSDEVMFKPFGAEDLVWRIDKLLAGRASGAASTDDEPAAPAAVAPATVAAAAAPAPPPAPPPSPVGVAEAAVSLKQKLEGLAATPGVRFVVLTDREGFVIETAGELARDTDEVAAALASCLAEASEGIGRELGQGPLLGTILEYEAGTLVLQAVGPTAVLAILVGDAGAVGKVRYYVRKAAPGLLQAL
jgi:CheY-like chemotaxis protein